MIGMQKHVGVAEALIDLLPEARFAVYDDDYDKIEWFDDRPLPSRSDVEATIERLREEAPLQVLREIRNWLIQESDWTQGQDVRALRGSEWCAAWDAYRQQLRDLPEAGFDLYFDELGVLQGFELPTKPEA